MLRRVLLVLCSLATTAVADGETFDVHAGAMVVDYDDAGLAGGPIAGLSVRSIDTGLARDTLGIAVVGDAELGYATELVGQLRAGVGLGVVHRWVSASLFGGGAIGSMGRAAPADLFVGGTFAVTAPELVAVWLEGARAFGIEGPNHDRLELRVVLPSRSVDSWWSWTVGVRYLAFGRLDASAGTAVLLTLGVGPNDSFEALVR